MSCIISESEVEEAALDILTELGYDPIHGPDIAPDTPATEMENYSEVILTKRLRSAISRINPHIQSVPEMKYSRKSQDLIHSNQAFHNMLVNGMDVGYRNNEAK